MNRFKAFLVFKIILFFGHHVFAMQRYQDNKSLPAKRVCRKGTHDETFSLIDQLAYAVQRNDESEVECLLNLGVNPNWGTHCSSRPLSCAMGKTKIVKLLLEHNANPNYKNPETWPPLVAAVFCIKPAESCRLLLEAGADPNIIFTAYGYSNPLEYAILGDSHGALCELLEGGANPVKTRDWLGREGYNFLRYIKSHDIAFKLIRARAIDPDDVFLHKFYHSRNVTRTLLMLHSPQEVSADQKYQLRVNFDELLKKMVESYCSADCLTQYSIREELEESCVIALTRDYEEIPHLVEACIYCGSDMRSLLFESLKNIVIMGNAQRVLEILAMFAGNFVTRYGQKIEWLSHDERAQLLRLAVVNDHRDVAAHLVHAGAPLFRALKIINNPFWPKKRGAESELLHKQMRQARAAKNTFLAELENPASRFKHLPRDLAFCFLQNFVASASFNN